MTTDYEFSIEKSTLEKILAEKRKSGFGDKSWDDWFNYILGLNKDDSGTKQEKIEKVVRNFFYKNDYEQWVKNFAQNLNHIWNETSARDLDPSKDSSYKPEEHSAIVIGRGPSLKKHKHLELLAESSYNGSIVCTDGALINVLKAGITPDKFSKFYVITIDAYPGVMDFYDNPLVDKYGHKINGVFSILTHPSVVERARKAGIKIHWLHTLFDFNEGRKSFNQISGTIVRAKRHLQGLPAIQTGGNVGTSSWFVSWQILKCGTIAFIGINHGWDKDDSLETIMSHGGNITPPKLDKDSKAFKELFPKIYNPEFKTSCILDPIFQYYSTALKEFISRSPNWVNTINATQGGSIFGKRIKCMNFHEFLASN